MSGLRGIAVLTMLLSKLTPRSTAKELRGALGVGDAGTSEDPPGTTSVLLSLSNAKVTTYLFLYFTIELSGRYFCNIAVCSGLSKSIKPAATKSLIGLLSAPAC